MLNFEEKFLPIFANFGLKDQEASVYFALLKIKQGGVREISRASKIQRTYVYDILRGLEEKGIVSCIEVRGRKLYSAISIDQFKLRQTNQLKKLENAIPEIKSLIGFSANSPKVQFYEGKDGFIEAQNDTLNMPRGSEILAYYTGRGFYAEDQKTPSDYIKKRIEKNIRVRAIGADTPEVRIWSENDAKQLRESRMVPEEKFPCENEINIYGDKVSILSLTNEMIAVVIESKSIANTQRAIFELAWEGADKYKK